jgi:3-oxoacyl-[acyl-carrier-protein] synthase II
MQRVERRVVVTGLGLLTPIGIGVEQVWNAALEGKSGIGPITRFDASDLPTRIAGEVKDFDPARYMDKKEARRNDLFIQFALAGAQLALEDARLPTDKPLGERCGVIVGSGMGGLATLEETHLVAVNKGFKRVSPFFIPSIIVNLAAGQVSIKHGAAGVNYAPVSACATGNHAIGESVRHLQHGDVDMMICGGAEATITLLGISGFTQPRALSERNDEPQKASRPFDLGRDGFVPGEGAGILILEELEHARARGARIYCELTGYAATADAYHVTTPSGLGAERAMKLCLEDAGLSPREVQYVNAHGTSTPVGDIAEVKAIKSVFGSWAKEGLLVSSTKSMTGHMLGAAGGVEAALTALTIFHGVVHPTINVEHQDPQCDVDVVPNVKRKTPVRAAISNSFGFGGTNAVIALQKFEEAKA